jgi:hypothetical protein
MKKIPLLLFLPVAICFLSPGHFTDISSTHLPEGDLRNNSMDVVSVDIDKDGDEDLVIASEFRQNLILLNDGKGIFTNGTAGRLPKKNHDSEDIAVADFDSDGDLDIIFVSEDDFVHEYYLNDGKGNFTDVSERINFRSKANSIIEGDFDKDGDIDVIIGNDGQNTYLVNDGKGMFKDETSSRLPVDNNTTQDIEKADMDGDGDVDLVLGNEDGNKLYLNDGKGTFTATSNRLPIMGSEETRKVDLADVDNDGDIDIFFSNVNFRQVMNPANRLLINDGKGNFTDETRTRYKGVNNLHTADADFTDLNKDGFKDLLVANIFGGYQQVFINDGKGVFTESTTEYFSSNPTTEVIAIEVGDWNKDEKVDVYLGVFREGDRLFSGK